MNIDINRLWRYIKINKERRLIIVSQHAGIGCLNGFQEIRMAHISPVYKEILLRFLGRILGLDDKPADINHLRLGVDVHKGRGIHVAFRVSEDGLNALFLCAGRQF